MPSSTSSSEPAAVTAVDWPRTAVRFARHAILVALAAMVIGEVWFRLPWTTRLIVFDFEEARGSRLAAPQRRGMGLGNFSTISPPIGINADGFRNGPIDWTAPTVLAVGSSETLGPGVEDDEVWTAVATRRLRAQTAIPVTVVNAGSAGYGPFHHAVTVRLFLERHPAPRAIVLRAAVSDRRFVRPTRAELDAAQRQKVISTRVKAFSEFLPFLVNRLQAQLVSIRSTFRPDPPSAQQSPEAEAPSMADAMWARHREWWDDIVGQAARAGVPLIFFVDGGDGAPSATRLAQLLEGAYASPGVTVTLFDARSTGLAGLADETRRRRYRDDLTLGDDPHGNARLHALVAEFLTPRLAPLLVRDDGRISAPEPPAAAARP